MTFQRIWSLFIRDDDSDHIKAVKTTSAIFFMMIPVFILTLFSRFIYTRRRGINRRLRREWQRLVYGVDWVLHLNQRTDNHDQSHHRQQQQQPVYLRNQSSSSGSSFVLSLGLTLSSSTHRRTGYDLESGEGSRGPVPLLGPFTMPLPLTSPQYLYDGDWYVDMDESSTGNGVSRNQAVA
ncbi:hypothetical protein ACHAQJ_009406 [Trichoderma viride]